MATLSAAETSALSQPVRLAPSAAGWRLGMAVAMAGALAAVSGQVGAATATATFQVDATVVSSCSVSATNHSFGNYDPLAALPATGTSTVTVQCTLLTPYNIALNPGGGTGATVTARKMTKGGSDTLTYSLYRDAAHALVWGETIGTDTLAFVGTGLAEPHLVYGQIPARQNVNPGTYNDTITVTVNF